VRGADTDAHDLAPEAAGLVALSLGLGCNYQETTSCLPRAWCCTTHSMPGAPAHPTERLTRFVRCRRPETQPCIADGHDVPITA
jgi:hypothetical protein